MPSALAFRYARALVDVVLRPGGGSPEAVAAEIGSFGRALAESTDLRIALESPAVPRPRKNAIINRLAQVLNLSDLTRRFLLVVIEHRRIQVIDEMREAFEVELDERLGVVRADVASARPLDKRQQAAVADTLARMTGKQTRAHFMVKEELIGGVVARIGSTVYDGSIRGQLEALRERLSGAEV